MSGIPDITLNHRRFRSSPHHPSAPAPMTIPRAQEQPVPPPLPPPSYIPISPNHDPGWQWGNDPNASDFGKSASVKPGSSLLGGAQVRAFGGRADRDNIAGYTHTTDWARRGSAISTSTTATITGHINDLVESGSLTPSDDGSMSRPGSDYRYVSLLYVPLRLFVFCYIQSTICGDEVPNATSTVLEIRPRLLLWLLLVYATITVTERCTLWAEERKEERKREREQQQVFEFWHSRTEVEHVDCLACVTAQP